MKTVKIKKEELLTKIKKNRNIHEAEYNQAFEGYKKAVINGLEELIANAKAGKELKTSINLPTPHNYTDRYDQIITMLEMSVEDVIEIDNSDFNKYVLDNWEWKAISKGVFDTYKFN